jgi:hypothetical protein
MIDVVFLLQYIILGVIIYSGLFAGKMLALIAPEELRPGKRNLILFQKGLYILVLVAFLFVIDSIIARIIILILLGYFVIRIRSSILHDNNYYLLYTTLGVFLGLSSWNFIIYPAFLSFLLGLPTASLNDKKSFGVYVKLFLVFFLFYIGCILIRNSLFVY